MKVEYKYIYFEETDSPKRKTKTFDCINTDGITMLGEIMWHNGWRQYCFFPAEDCVFAKSCLEDINHFIQQLMDERRQDKEDKCL